jgi:hypothetical protein
VLPATAQLNGSVSDDGLPVPPGQVSAAWTLVSGPGTVTFSNASDVNGTATFSAAGVYVIRLTATDGALQTAADVKITVQEKAAPPKIDSVAVISGGASSFQFTFTTSPGVSYTVQYCDSLVEASWTKLSDIPAEPVSRTLTVNDSTMTQSSKRYYRIQVSSGF